MRLFDGISRAFVLLLFLFGGLGLHAQASAGPFAIASVDFAVEGRPLAFILRYKVNIPIGKAFADTKALQAYLADKRQILLNERTLQSVSVSYETGAVGADGLVPVAVLFHVKESWNIIALPKPTYDSNSGLLLSVRGRDYDFAGSMQTLSLDLNYTYDQLGRTGFGGATSFSIPFLLGSFEASAGGSSSVTIYADGTPTASSSSLNLSLTDRRFGFPLTYSASQGLTSNPNLVSNDSDPYYLTDTVSAASSFVVAEQYGPFGELDYAPSVSLSQMWRFEAPVRQDRQGTIASFSQSIAWGRVNWVGNSEKGVLFSFSNTDSLNLWFMSTSIGFDASAGYYQPLFGPFSIKTRLQLFDQVTGAVRTTIGGSMRGIIDARLNGVAGGFFNLDLPVRLFDFPTHAIIGPNWLDFQAQMAPFIDVGEVEPNYGMGFSSSTTWLSGGVEGYVFPLRMRSFIIRASLGFDLKNYLETHSLTAKTFDGNSPYELYIGLGLLY